MKKVIVSLFVGSSLLLTYNTALASQTIFVPGTAETGSVGTLQITLPGAISHTYDSTSVSFYSEPNCSNELSGSSESAGDPTPSMNAGVSYNISASAIINIAVNGAAIGNLAEVKSISILPHSISDGTSIFTSNTYACFNITCTTGPNACTGNEIDSEALKS